MTGASDPVAGAPLFGIQPSAGLLFALPEHGHLTARAEQAHALAVLGRSGTLARSAGGPCLSEEQVGTVSRAVFGRRPYKPASPDVCRVGGWTVALWDIATGELTLHPFRCKSWRCKRCGPLVNARAAARIEVALGKRCAGELVFVTLTFDQRRLTLRMLRRRPELSFEQAAELARQLAWRRCGRAWKKLRDRLAHRYAETFKVANPKPRGRRRKAWLLKKRKARMDYVQTWEQHASGWPHVHAVVWGPELARDVRRCGSYEAVDGRVIQRWTKRVLVPLAVRSGFGRIADVQFPRKGEAAMAGYLVKLAGELTGSHTKDQTPVEAPRGFRRLRATPLWLERLRKASARYVGAVLGAPLELIERALDVGAESLEQAAGWARASIERGPDSKFTRLLRFGSIEPPLREALRLEWERG